MYCLSFDRSLTTAALPKDTKEIHGLVAEAMIMANAYVGKRVYDGFKEAAILRRHPPPNPGQFDMLVKAAESRVSWITKSLIKND